MGVFDDVLPSWTGVGGKIRGVLKNKVGGVIWTCTHEHVYRSGFGDDEMSAQECSKTMLACLRAHQSALDSMRDEPAVLCMLLRLNRKLAPHVAAVAEEARHQRIVVADRLKAPLVLQAPPDRKLECVGCGETVIAEDEERISAMQFRARSYGWVRAAIESQAAWCCPLCADLLSVASLKEKLVDVVSRFDEVKG